MRALWRKRLRPFLRGKRWLILATVACTAYVVGYLGYRELDEPRAAALYYSLQLFALESATVEDPSWMITLARFLAPAVAAAAAVQAAFVLFRDQLQLLGVRYAVRDHVVVAGLGSVGYGLAVAFSEANLRVVAIEPDRSNAAIASCRERGISIVEGDASDPNLLEKTRLGRARLFIVTCGDDVTNLDVVIAATRVVADRQDEPAALVHLGDLALWRRLQAEMLGTARRLSFRVEFFNVLDAGARVLLDAHPPFSDTQEAEATAPHLLFIGLDEVGEFVVLHAAGRWRNLTGGSRGPLRVTVVGTRAREQVRDLFLRYPELTELCNASGDDDAVAEALFHGGDFVRRNSRSPFTRVYICLANESEALTAALVLRAQPELRETPIVVTVWQEEAGIPSLINVALGPPGGVSEFPVLTSTLHPDMLLLGMNEVLAQLRHEHYVLRERAKGDTPETNPSLVPWEELNESLKESNRAFADHVGSKLAASGCVLVPAPLAAADSAPPVFADEQIEELARDEHERWMKDLERLGWRWTSEQKDAVRKLHPLLVPWEELGEDDRERDRDSIRALPRMLARAGFAVHRRSEG